MKAALLLPAILALAACAGSAPPVDDPSKALNNDGLIRQRCIDNTPPPGYQGPVSPYSGACGPQPGTPAARQPAGTFDYSKGQPPRAVR
jgi:hypothetical protein